MIRINIGCNLKHESCKSRFLRIYFPFLGFDWTRTRSYFHKAIQKFFYSKVIQCRAKENRSKLPLQIFFYFKIRIYTFYKFQLTTQFICQLRTNLSIQFLGMDIDFHLLRHDLLTRLKQIQIVFIDIVNPFKPRTALNRPCQWTYMNVELLLQFIQQVKWIFCLTVHLVHKNNDWRITHTTNFHQLTRLCLHTFCAIHYYNYTINCSQRTIGIFSKILMSWCIKNIYLIIMVIEFHD